MEHFVAHLIYTVYDLNRHERQHKPIIYYIGKSIYIFYIKMKLIYGIKIPYVILF